MSAFADGAGYSIMRLGFPVIRVGFNKYKFQLSGFYQMKNLSLTLITFLQTGVCPH
jgi:hypothetical protein